ncbi:hypothetical protein Poly51_20200 [Rubripirellula tenax]|uniref:J domain-containing protein n=1 Tax=Rubripirellula tenax TaxID=2528015 RepID=A0A5C6FGD4_9BACT|nr:hypothetical protein [Rubripirellula tenax]TWU59234.1 hypothetical protein Poly51_20200 [Rubripirellula tenax]
MADRQPAGNHYAKFLGIVSDSVPPDHYALLGLERFESDVAKIDQAAKQQAARLHQLASGPDRATIQELMGRVAVARRSLTNPDQKRKYDAQLRNPTAHVDAGNRDAAAVSPIAISTGTSAANTKSVARPRQPPRGLARHWTAVMTGTMLIVVIFLAYILMSRIGSSSLTAEPGPSSPAGIEAQRTQVLERLGKPIQQAELAKQAPEKVPEQTAKQQTEQQTEQQAKAAQAVKIRRAKRRAAAAKRKKEVEAMQNAEK